MMMYASLNQARIFGLSLMVFLMVMPAWAHCGKKSDGWSMSLSGGSNHCVGSGTADCESVGGGPTTLAGIEYRWGSVGFGLDLGYGIQFADGAGADDVSISALRANPAIRYYIDLGQWELLTGFGFGYSQYKVVDNSNSEVESEARFTALASAFTLTWGGYVPLQAGPRGLGLLFRADATFHPKGERCVLWSNAGVCEQIEELEDSAKDIAGVMGLTMGVRYTF